MKKKLATAVCAAFLSLAVCAPAFAGEWVSDSNGWWWRNDDGGYPAAAWAWLDGNRDGIAESYYFDANGYCVTNATTPDGYTVNADGAWTVNGVVQTKQVSVSTPNTQTTNQAGAEAPDVTGTYQGTYNGGTITCEIGKGLDGTLWVEIDYFLKDNMPAYTGNGVFADAYNRFTFNGNNLTFEDLYSNETVQFVKQ